MTAAAIVQELYAAITDDCTDMTDHLVFSDRDRISEDHPDSALIARRARQTSVVVREVVGRLVWKQLFHGK